MALPYPKSIRAHAQEAGLVKQRCTPLGHVWTDSDQGLTPSIDRDLVRPIMILITVVPKAVSVVATTIIISIRKMTACLG